MTDLLPLVQEFHREKLAMLLRHQDSARVIGQYDVNNTYQYIINREEAQLSWLASAIADFGGAVGDTDPGRTISGKGAAAAPMSSGRRTARCWTPAESSNRIIG